MYSLFRLLTKSSYWRMLLRGDTWREAGLSLRRAHKDKRARKHLGKVLLLALIPVICLLYLAWLAGSGALYFIPFVIPVIWWRSRQARRYDVASLSIVPDDKPTPRELTAQETAALRRFFAEMGLAFAVMLDRAGSESFLKQKVLPEGFVVTSRRTQLDLLQGLGIWERMPQPDRLALMEPDGHWEWERINQSLQAMEPLRLLRWILRLDYFLPVIGQQLKGDFSLAHELVQEPRKLLEGSGLIELSEMITGRDAAHHFYLRCVAEGIHRGHLAPKTDEAAAWAKGVVDRLQGKQHEDFVLGTELVSEASDELLGWALALAERRVQFLNWAMKVRETGEFPADLPGVLPAPAAAELETSQVGV